MGKFIDLTGRRFGRLVVVKYNGLKNKRGTWLCECSCGNKKIIDGRSLRSRNTQSCGCLNIEKIKLSRIGNKDTRLPRGVSSFNGLYTRYKSRATIKKLTFELSKDKFKRLLDGNCWYCNKKPSQKYKTTASNGEYIYNGIDRLNSSLGYIENNVVSCCGECNKAKSITPQQDFYSWIEKVYTNLKEKGEI